MIINVSFDGGEHIYNFKKMKNLAIKLDCEVETIDSGVTVRVHQDTNIDELLVEFLKEMQSDHKDKFVM